MALKFANNQSLTNTTALPSAVPTDNLILISTQTASSSATISFTTGIDSTYDEYIFKYINVKAGTGGEDFRFNMSTDSGSNYNVTKTTTAFRTTHNESDSTTSLEYRTDMDLAQSTAFQTLANGVGSGADECVSGTLTIFNPSSTTYVKHFIGVANALGSDFSIGLYTAGYGNTTSAVNAIRFQMSSGNIADGIIKLYGVKKS